MHFESLVRRVALAGVLTFAVGAAGCARPIAPRAATPPATTVYSPVDEQFVLFPNTGPDYHPQRSLRCGHDWSPPGCMMRVTGGALILGAQAGDPAAPNYDPAAGADEGPPHEVQVDGFWMHYQEVSAQHFGLCVDAGACRVEDVERSGGAFDYGDRKRELFPVNGVNWRGASDYCAWIGGRLPTEAEFEYAARGPSYRPFPWGAEPPSCPSTIMSNGCGAGGVAMLPVGRAGPFPIHNLVGNLWEWMADWYAEDYYRQSPRDNPMGPDSGTQRSQRGGSWMSEDPAELRVSARARLDPESRLPDIGFRCVRPAGIPR